MTDLTTRDRIVQRYIHTWDIDVRMEGGLSVGERLECAVDRPRNMDQKLRPLEIQGVAHHLGGINSALRDEVHLSKYRSGRQSL